LVQMNGCGCSFQPAIHARMLASSACTLLWTPRRSIWSVKNPNHRSTWLVHDEPVGVKCTWNRGWRASHDLTAGVLFGPKALIQRCRRHKERNVTDHLPEAERPLVQRRLRAAWALGDADQARAELAQLARSLDRKRPGAAASLREGPEQTLTVTRLGIVGSLLQTVESTNPVESMIEIVSVTMPPG
jgi:Transposase, Mutator family